MRNIVLTKRLYGNIHLHKAAYFVNMIHESFAWLMKCWNALSECWDERRASVWCLNVMEIVNNLTVWLLAMLLKELVLISSYTSYDSGFIGPIVSNLSVCLYKIHYKYYISNHVSDKNGNNKKKSINIPVYNIFIV